VTKAALRKIYKEKRKQISFKDKERWTDLILINFQKLELPFINCVHTYLAIEDQNEVDTENICNYLTFKNPRIKIVVPKINLNEGEMQHYIFNEDVEMASNSFGIIEPVKGEKVSAEEIDLVITPLLAFDKKGYRVGYGKGFYDKFFLQCNNDVIRVGLSFFDSEEIIVDVDAYDIPMHYCITPHSVYTF
jgi:5-formyltetrahydrofolate cyclo-ligase